MRDKIRDILVSRPVALKVARNVFWLFLERVLRMATGLCVAVAFARFLGPEKFGLLNLSLAYVAIFGALSALALNGVVPREILRKPDQTYEILGSAFVLNMIGALIFYALLITSAYVLNPENAKVVVLVSVIGLSLFFKSSQIINYWFESQVNSKQLVWAESSVMLALLPLKVWLVWIEAPLVTIAGALAAETGFIALVAVALYSRTEASPLNWMPYRATINALMRQAWPLLISSGAWIIYTRTDQIMIGNMLGNEALGYYSAAIRLSDAVNILPALIVVSIVPAITLLREENLELYREKFQVIYDLAVGLSLAFSLLISILSTNIISLGFGESYENSSTVLSIHVWATVFISMAFVSGRYLINEGRQIITMWRHIAGIGINVVLNYVLVGIYGINGAAIATVLTLFIVNYLLDILHSDTRVCFVHKSRAFLMLSLARRIREHLNRR